MLRCFFSIFWSLYSTTLSIETSPSVIFSFMRWPHFLEIFFQRLYPTRGLWMPLWCFWLSSTLNFYLNY
jgi:hypothetical protein